MKSNKEVLKRLAGVEKRLAVSAEDLEQKKNSEDLQVLLESYDYCLKEQEMTMTHEEIRKANEENTKYFLEWYEEWQKLSPEEQKEKSKRDHDEEIAQDRAWLNSDERRQFDLEYAEYLKRKNLGPA